MVSRLFLEAVAKQDFQKIVLKFSGRNHNDFVISTAISRVAPHNCAIGLWRIMRHCLRNVLEALWKRRRKYHDNYVGLRLASFHIPWNRKNYYYCAELVGALLILFSFKVLLHKETAGRIVRCQRLRLYGFVTNIYF